MVNNENRSYPNASDLMRFLESHMLGVDGGKHNLRREIFWNSTQVEAAIRAYFETMPQPVVFGTTIMLADQIERLTPEQVQHIGEDVWRNLGSVVLQRKDAIYHETKRDALTNEITIGSYLRILPWKEER